MLHKPVLYQEIIHALQPHRGCKYVDGTIGAGGHAWGILQESSPDGLLLGLDVDPEALRIAAQRLSTYKNRLILVHASYLTIKEQLTSLGWYKVNGIVLDLGLSSMQLDSPERGFSFRDDAPLDMRFNPQSEVTAYDVVNHSSEKELARILYIYGEERRSRQIAKAIVASRPINTTGELAWVVRSVAGRWRTKIDPATRTFQAIRIAVNRELEQIEKVLPMAVDVLEKGGRLAVIAFHSLEDRLVKHYFNQESKDCICPPEQLVCTCNHRAKVKVITRHPIRPSEKEVIENPRARSARLRIVEKI